MRENYIRNIVNDINVNGYDAMLICPSEELNFFIGFTPLMCERFQGLFIKKDGSMFYFCNLLTGEEWENATEGVIPVYTWFDNEDMAQVIRKVFEKEQLIDSKIAVNSSAQAFNIIKVAAATGATFYDGVPLLEHTRIYKSEYELSCLRKAASIADEGFMRTLPQIRVGMSEKEVFDILTGEMTKLGGADAGALIASGPNAGYPHYHDYGRIIEEGDAVIMDFGCLYNNLHSDMTRTVFFGPVSEEKRKLYALLLRAQEKAEATAKEGVMIPLIDKAAREVLDEEGLASTCTTRVGHGIGYMTHEAPYITAMNNIPLERGMCFSVEPGIYLPGKLGMRIEDIVTINLAGEREVLNKAPKCIISIQDGNVVYDTM